MRKTLNEDKDYKCYLQYAKVKDKILQFKCLNCNKNCKKSFDEDLNQRFADTYGFCQGGISKLILILQKGVYPYEYMKQWEKFSAISSPAKVMSYCD